MSDLIIQNEGCSNAMAVPLPGALPLPGARVQGAVSVRLATLADVAFIDALQKKHSMMVGWRPRGQIEKRISEANVLIAEQTPGSENRGTPGTPIGYCMYTYRYEGEDHTGAVFQLNIDPASQRGYVGGRLIKEVFERAPYQCRLFCCWCAQDLPANRFWESLGFVPLAFRTGSRRAKRYDGTYGPRIHIFWQRRVRQGDDRTEFWYPAKTQGGDAQEDRIALPIPPGTHWSDVMPALLPGVAPGVVSGTSPALPAGSEVENAEGRKASAPRKSKSIPAVPKPKVDTISRGGLRFVPGVKPPPAAVEPKASKPKRERLPKQKHDARHIEAARELAARSMEQLNFDRLLPPAANGKYDVSRQLAAADPATLEAAPSPHLLEAA